MNLKKRIFSASAWTVGTYGVEIILRLVSSLVLSRLLFPEAFGLVSASSSLIVALALFSDLGIRAVIIQSPRGDNDEFLRSAWVFQLFRGLSLWVLLIIICSSLRFSFIKNALPQESAFANEMFPVITLALGFGLVLSGFESTAVFLNIRQMKFRPFAVIDILAKVTTIAVMIGFAFEFRNVWALVAGNLFSGVLRLVLSHTLVPGPWMAWRWNRDHFREIIHFGKWITVSSLASFFASQCDFVILGMLLSGSSLGVYSIAKTLVSAVHGFVERINSGLALSVLGEVLRENPAELRKKYYRFRFPIDVLSAFSSGVLFATGQQIVSTLYDPRYAQAGPMLQLLAIGLALYPLQLIRSAFTAIGQPYVVAAVSIIDAAFLILSLIGGYLAFGVLGAVAGIAISDIMPSLAYLILAHRQRWLSIWHELRIVPMFIAGVALSEIGLFVGRSFAPESLEHFFR
ncbi:MAG TPA: oligosaccharide flippase family protein [Chthoniobacterales bacterium]|nr:oligosaccharide flippase family protein [Chthoniobacterales bacterium]